MLFLVPTSENLADWRINEYILSRILYFVVRYVHAVKTKYNKFARHNCCNYKIMFHFMLFPIGLQNINIMNMYYYEL